MANFMKNLLISWQINQNSKCLTILFNADSAFSEKIQINTKGIVTLSSNSNMDYIETMAKFLEHQNTCVLVFTSQATSNSQIADISRALERVAKRALFAYCTEQPKNTYPQIELLPVYYLYKDSNGTDW